MQSLIIIPTYNEKEGVEKLIQRVFTVLPDTHILVVDDNSPDGTGDLVDQISLKNQQVSIIHRKGKMGLGTAYLDGFRWGLSQSFDYLFEMDGDFSHDPQYLPAFIKKMEEGYDVVIGSRYLEGISVIHWDLKRLLLSKWAAFYTSLITGLPLTDPMAGYKCYRREVLERIPLDKIKSNGYSFQMETHFRAWKMGFKLAEIPIVFVERLGGKSKMGAKIILEAAIMALRLRLGLI